ncbi:Ig-like domain-containing protein [Leifsonia poae]|uniref:Ig-like domain-containing protein n=1 Tax=Leifsonia poae TaxID=110933 RepID=UPI003D68D96E
MSGTATPGDAVAVSAGSTPGSAESCRASVRDDGHWSCGLTSLPDGPSVAVRAEAQTGSAASDRVMVLHPPVIASGGTVPTTGAVRGTAYPGARVTVRADTGATCTFPADSSGAWGCVLGGDLGDGHHTVTATQVADFSSQRSASSARVVLNVDRTAPPPPAIAAPTGSVTPGAPIAFTGSGESGAHVTLYASTGQGTVVLCTADVAAGAWACQGALPAGSYSVSALQRDAAGNVSGGSNVVALTVAGPAAAPSPSRTPSPSPTPTPAAPAPVAPGATPPTSSGPSDLGQYDAPFTTASAPVVSAAALPGWMRSAGLAIAALLLLVLPARLLAAALARGRRERGRRGTRGSVFGRNRPRADVSDASALFGSGSASARGAEREASDAVASGAAASATASTGISGWTTAAVGAATVLLVSLSAPVSEAGAYPGVLLAIALAVAVINAVWVLAGRGLATHLHLPAPRLVLRPGMLVVVAVAALGSRVLGLSPALLFALVLGLAMGPHAGRVRRGRISAVQVSAVAALGVLAWLAVGALPAATTPFTAFLAEFVNVLALAGIGSAAVALLPVGGLAGRAIAKWSRWLWGGLSLVVYTVLFALLLPVASLVEHGVGVIVIVGVAVGFAAASVAFWLWERYVVPALDRTAP